MSAQKPQWLQRDGWRHSERWKREGGNFLVEVSRHTRDLQGADDQEQLWCVYLYVYPGHPDFIRFDPAAGIWGQPHYHCHSYPSMFRAHYDAKGVVTSYQLGWDYSHDGDSDYLQYVTPDDAGSVFWDASQLFVECAERAQVAAGADK